MLISTFTATDGVSGVGSVTIDAGRFTDLATNDNIAVIDYRKGKILRHIPIKVDPQLDSFRGLLPFGITISKDGSTLYVALLGFNAVAVIDTKTDQTLA